MPPSPHALLSAATNRRRDFSSSTGSKAVNRWRTPARPSIQTQDSPKHPQVEMLFLNEVKALPDHGGIGIAVLDGHESHASYLQHCAGCLERTMHTGNTDRTQFYHRQVTLMLLPGARPGCEPIRLLLDHEPQRPGEDEVATALRLLAR